MPNSACMLSPDTLTDPMNIIIKAHEYRQEHTDNTLLYYVMHIVCFDVLGV